MKMQEITAYVGSFFSSRSSSPAPTAPVVAYDDLDGRLRNLHASYEALIRAQQRKGVTPVGSSAQQRRRS
jgi:hypothetical protein